MVSLPLVGSQCCPARVYDKTFQSFGDKTTLSKSFGFSFSQSNVGTFKQVSTSFGLSKRRISAVFSCFGQSLILPAASIQRSQTLLFNTMVITLNTPKYGASAGKALAGLCFAVGDHEDHVDLDDHDDHVDLDEHDDHVDLDDCTA